jgi:hypothetical protein
VKLLILLTVIGSLIYYDYYCIKNSVGFNFRKVLNKKWIKEFCIKYQIILLILLLFSIFQFAKWQNDNNKIEVNRPKTGDLYESPEQENIDDLSASPITNNIQNQTSNDIQFSQNETGPPIKKEPDYSLWDKTNYQTGQSPECFNFEDIRDLSIDNRLQIKVGRNIDVVLKLISLETDQCIRYVYIRAGDTYSIKNIPEGKYYTKIAYGKDWRQTIKDGQCIGRFISRALYKKGKEILDFNKIYEGIKSDGENEYSSYSIPSFNLELDVVQSELNGKFTTNSISEEDFNK